jgi:hypothetical protein
VTGCVAAGILPVLGPLSTSLVYQSLMLRRSRAAIRPPLCGHDVLDGVAECHARDGNAMRSRECSAHGPGHCDGGCTAGAGALQKNASPTDGETGRCLDPSPEVDHRQVSDKLTALKVGIPRLAASHAKQEAAHDAVGRPCEEVFGVQAGGIDHRHWLVPSVDVAGAAPLSRGDVPDASMRFLRS